MPINLTTYLSGQDVTPTEDAIVYEYATNDDGIIFGCDVSQKSDNKIFVASGHGIFHGRKFTVLEETIQVPLTSNANEKKKLIVHMDLANRSNPIEFLIQPASKDLIQQKNLNLINGIYELELATFTVTSTNVTNLKQTFTLLKRGKPTVTVDDVVGLDTEITKLEEFDKKISGDVTRLKTDKADKSVAQMYKFVADDGQCSDTPPTKNIDLLTSPGAFRGYGFTNLPKISELTEKSYVSVLVFKSNTVIIQFIFNGYNSGIYKRIGNTAWPGSKKWLKWQQLATTDQAQMHKLTQDNGTPIAIDKTKINDNLDTGLYYMTGVSINGNTYNGYLEAVKLSDNWAKQVFTTHMSGLVFNRVLNNKIWTPWQKLGGIDAKVYDIVLLDGMKPYKNATELDNKVVVYNGVAHMKLNLNRDSLKVEGRVKLPKNVAVNLKPDGILTQKRGWLTSAETWGRTNVNHDSVFNKMGEIPEPTLGLQVKDFTTQKDITTVYVNKSYTDSWNDGSENRIGYYTWYVGGAK